MIELRTGHIRDAATRRVVAWLVLATGCASSNSTTNVTTGAHYGWGERMFRDWNRSAFEQRSESWRHFYWCPDMHYKNGESAGNQ